MERGWQNESRARVGLEIATPSSKEGAIRGGGWETDKQPIKARSCEGHLAY